MNSRERVLTACSFREPDRVPIDLGGSTGASGIHVLAYDRLREHLGLSHGRVRCNDLMQQLAVIDGDIRTRFGLDVAAIDGTCLLRAWEAYRLYPDLAVELPVGLDLRMCSDREWVLHDAAGTLFRKPPGSCYFDAADGVSWHSLSPAPTDEDLVRLQEYASALFRETDLALCARFGGAFASHQPQFLMDLALEPERVDADLTKRCDDLIATYERLYQAIGEYTFCIVFADDLGTQKAPIMGPELFARRIAPHYKRFCDWLHSRTEWKLYLHSCGAIEPLIDALIEAGIDILNPVQTSAAGMDPSMLKRKYGGRIVFWGGGCDTQRVLGFVPPERVAEHVRERIGLLAPGGGFVFNQVHAIQGNVDPESTCAMLDAAREFGRYPIEC